MAGSAGVLYRAKIVEVNREKRVQHRRDPLPMLRFELTGSGKDTVSEEAQGNLWLQLEDFSRYYSDYNKRNPPSESEASGVEGGDCVSEDDGGSVDSNTASGVNRGASSDLVYKFFEAPVSRSTVETPKSQAETPNTLGRIKRELRTI